MRRRLTLAVLALVLVPFAVAEGHLLDHPVPTTTGTAPPLSTQFNSGGENAEWELLATIPTLNPHSDLDFFQQKGITYASVGNLGVGANGGGQVIFRLTNEEGEIDPEQVSNIPTASCLSDPIFALGLQHDVEATPKASTIANTEVPQQNTQDTRLLLDATDAGGRCHDQGLTSSPLIDAPYGGIEIIDVTDVANPKEIGLTSHIGEAHTVNVDPRRPHIAYVVSSDAVGVDEEGKRANDDPEAGSGTRRLLDGFEIVNLRSCLEAPLGTIAPGATIEQKREACRPQVYRYRYPSIDIALGHTNRTQVHGCHELEVYPDDRLTCGAGDSAILFDIKGLFDDNGTPDIFTDDDVNGAPLPCSVRDSSTEFPGFATGAKITDCVVGEGDKDLSIPSWKELGAPSAVGIKHVGSAFHMGREPLEGEQTPAYPATEDIDFDHELEFTDSRKFIIATDERGGGVTGGAQCSPGVDLDFANGGLHAYAVDRLQKATPGGTDPEKRAEHAFRAYAKDSEGNKAIYRVPVETQPQPSFCTAHVFQQIPGENRIFMGWYSQGTQVIDFTENKDGTLDFKRAGYFIPENANQWVSAIFKVERNPDGTTTYYGMTGDGIVGTFGRQGVDIYKVTLPAAPLPPNRVPPPNAEPGTNPNAPNTPGLPNEPTPQPGCAVASGFSNASVAPQGKGLRFDFSRSVDAPVRADVFQSSIGKRLVNKRVKRFEDRTQSFTWNGRKKGLRNGTFVARLRIKVPGGGVDTRRFSLQRKGGKFKLLPAFKAPKTCGLIKKAEFRRNVFGGGRNQEAAIRFRLNEAAKVSAVVKRGNKTVKTFKARTFQADRTASLLFRAKPRGLYTVTLNAERGQSRATITLSAKRV